MTKILTLRALGIVSGFLLASFYAAAASTDPHLPAETAMNKEAGRGGLLFVTLRLDDGEELPFLFDTGATGTVFDKSLEYKLGKRLGIESSSGWGAKGKANTFAAPKLYLGNTLLRTGDKIWTSDLNHPSGILGMDCLKHYCIQMDFEAGKMRFLDSDTLNIAQLGKAYPLVLKGNLPFILYPGLLGGSNSNVLIDMGCRVDGLAQKTETSSLVRFLPDCAWDGLSYSNIAVAAVDHANVLGIRFFARHLVTLDFPKGVMYLKQISCSSLVSDGSMKFSNEEIEAPVKFLEMLRGNGQLPGSSKDDEAAICLEAYSNFDSKSPDPKSLAYVKAYFDSNHKAVTFTSQHRIDGSLYHCTVSRASRDNSWKMEKAWRTKEGGKTVEEYSVP